MASWKDRRLGNQGGGGSAQNEGQSFSSRRHLSNDDGDGAEVVEFKVVMVGTIGVGKTSIACRYIKDTFREFVNATIGASYMWKKEPIDDKLVKFSLWDTAGQEQFHSLVPMYFRETDAVVLVVDVTRPTCVEEASMWLDKVRSNAPPHAVVYVALNKCDNEEKRLLPLQEIEKFCEANTGSSGGLNLMCGEVSAKVGTGIHDMFVTIGKACLQRRQDSMNARGGGGGGAQDHDTVRLSSPKNRGGKKDQDGKKCKC